MYCSNCGSDIEKDEKFCRACGAENANRNMNDQKMPVARPETKKEKKILWIILAAVVAISLLVGYLIYDNDRVALKYDWGVPMQEILADGGLRGSDRVAYIEKCEDVDEIEEFSKEFFDVYFYFEENRLVRITYKFDPVDNMEYAEQLDIVSDYFGDNYFCTNDHADSSFMARADLSYWWKDGTVVRLEDGDMTYYDEEYFMDEYRADYKVIKDFFGK